MIPCISNLSKTSAVYAKFFEELGNSSFSGDISCFHSQRLLCATDNSVYQCMPEGVIYPRTEQDIVTVFRLRNREEFQGLIITPRGGGTGTNGQSLNKGICLDCSRYMQEIFDFDGDKREVCAQSGVIKDELNDFLKPHGLFFSPELSTSSRATLGGMVSNDAAGQGSLRYGRTSTHVKELRVVLADGSPATFGPVSGEELQRCLKKEGLEGDIYRGCYALLKEHSAEVAATFPVLNRFMTGYDLHHAYDPGTGTLNLARLVCGAEGTLAAVVWVKLDLTPLPAFRELLVIKYRDFDSALRHARPLIKAGALSVETVDSRVLTLAKKDVVWLSVKDYITEVSGHEILGVNIVEFASGSAGAGQEHQKLEALKAEIEKSAAAADGGILGVQSVTTAAGIAAVYGMRKKAVGLLGNAAGERKLVPFTEDTVVPPEELADYIAEFRALLDSMQVPYGMFGHVDTGLMHVRPALDLTRTEEREKLIKISKGVAALVKKYHGQMWGEHGRGYRSCFGELFFGKLYPTARRVKELFDAGNILNPGKICVPFSNDTAALVALDGPMRGDLDRTVPAGVRTAFRGAIACNGNGQCFSYRRSELMCPSYRYTRDHVRSPKGYAELMREWLRLLNDRTCSASAEEVSLLTSRSGPGRLLRRFANTLSGRDDYNHEYLEQLRTCLACKACSSICPAHVNAAELNSRFLFMYYGRYLRPAMDLLVLNAEWLVPRAAKFPALAKAIVRSTLNRRLLEKFFGIIDLPEFSPRTLTSLCKAHGFHLLKAAAALEEAPEVLVVTDPFTAAYEAEELVSFAAFIRCLGFSVQFLRPYVNGKLLMVRGARRSFVHFASKQAARLSALASRGITLVGFDPALTLCYRDEYVSMLDQLRGDFEVLLPEEWLGRAVKSGKVQMLRDHFKEGWEAALKLPEFSEPYYLFTHCTERALLPASTLMWQQVLKAFGLKLVPVPVACCGMAGLHGHMAANREETFKVYAMNWHGELTSRPFERCLVTGYSCRSQVERMERRRPAHPVGVLLKLLQRAGIKDGTGATGAGA